MRFSYFFQYFYKTSVLHSTKAVLVLLLIFSSTISFALPSYQILVIPTDEPAEAVAINDDGQVAGFVEHGDNTLAFVYHPADGIQFLQTLGGETSKPLAMNESGQVVGTSLRKDNLNHAFLWNIESGMTDLTPLHTGNSAAEDISNSGIVIGTLFDSSSRNAFEWTEDSGLLLATGIQEGHELIYLGVADNGVKLVKLVGPDSSVGISYLLSSIPDENDLFLGRTASGTGKVTVKTINRNAVAAGWRKARSGALSTFIADANTLEITDVLVGQPFIGPPTIAPTDINEKKWLLSEVRPELFIPGDEEPFRIEPLITESNGVTDLHLKQVNNHGDITGYGLLSDGSKVAIILINENRDPQPSLRIAQYQTDFAKPPKSGWTYQWNADAPIGQPENYVDMLWDRWKYDSNGLPGLPDESGLAYGHFSSTGGHPGRGVLQGETSDRYVIAGYVVDEPGDYTISDSQIVHNGCEFGNGGVVHVYVDDNLINSFSYGLKRDTSFDGSLGFVNAESIIYVAVGAKGKDSCDGFDWDYAIELIGASGPINNRAIHKPQLKSELLK